jgi:threonine/homoserine/homoserine lactone efflux protein
VSALGALHAVAVGFGLGVVSGMPLGVINIAIVDAATAGRPRFAGGLGLGGSGADTIHAGLAFAGVGRLVTADPALVRGLAIGAAVVIVGYAVVAWRRRERAAQPRPGPQADPVTDDAPMSGAIATGFMLTLPNPGSLGAWVAVATFVWHDASPVEAVLIAGGVGSGSALWFTILARWVDRVRRAHPGSEPRSRTLKLIPRVTLVVLIAIAIAGVVRAL